MRHFKHKFLFGLLPILALFGIVGTSIKDVQPLAPLADRLEANETTEIYHLSHDTSSIDLYFNANLKAYRHATRSVLTEIKDGLLESFKDIAKDQIDLVEAFSNNNPEPNHRAYRQINRAPGGTDLGVPFVLARTMMLQFYVDGQTRSSAVMDYAEGYNEAYATTTKLSISYYVDAQTTGTRAENAYNCAYETAHTDALGIGKTLQDFVDEVYTDYGLEVPDLAQRIYDLYCVELIGESVKPTAADVTNVVAVVQEALDETVMTVENIFTSFGDAASTDVQDILVAEETTAQDIKNLLTTVDSEVLGQVVEVTGVTGEQMKTAIETLGVTNLIEVADTIGIEGLREITSHVDGLDKQELTDFVVENITARDIFKAIKSVKVDDLYIVVDRDINFENVRELLGRLPRPAQIRNFSDDEMKLSYDIVLTTSVGDVSAKFTVGLFGNCNWVRKVAGFIADTLTFQKVDGKYIVTIKAPEKFYKGYLWFCETETIPDDLKHEVVDTLFSSVEDIREYLHNKTLEALVADLKTIDYETIAQTLANAEKWNEIFGRNFVTDERIDEAIDAFFRLISKGSSITYERVKEFIADFVDTSSMDGTKIEELINKFADYCAKIDAKHLDHETFRQFIDSDDMTYTNNNVYENIDRLLNYQNLFDRIKTKLLDAYDRLPEKHRQKSLMDFYVGDSKFVYDDSLTVGHERFLAHAKQYLPSKLYEAVELFVNKLPTTVNLKIDATFPHIHQVTYMMDEVGGSTENAKVIALPLYANVSFFANVTEIGGKSIVKWVYADGSAVNLMPDHDVVVYPVFERTLVVTPDVVNETWTGEAFTLTALTNFEDNYTYAWFKVASAGDILVGNESTLNITNVNESGVYYCQAYLGNIVLESNQVEVTINPAVLDLTGHYEWSEIAPTYTGSAIAGPTITIDPSVAGYIQSIVYGGDTSAVSAGEYLVNATITVDGNHILVGGQTSVVLEEEWSIAQQAIDVAGLSVGATSATYDGTAHAFAVEGAVPAHVVLTYTYEGVSSTEPFEFTEAGSYDVTVTLSVDSDDYVIAGDTVSGVYTFVVNQKDIPVSAFSFDATSFTYDEEAHLPHLVVAAEYQALVTVGEPVITCGGEVVSEAVKPGEYHVAYTVALVDANNYSLAQLVYEVNFTILRAKIVLPELLFEGAEYAYEEGVSHALSLKVAEDESLFEDERLVVSYKYNGVELLEGAENPGTYSVVAEIAIIETDLYEFAEDYQLVYEATLVIGYPSIEHFDCYLSQYEFKYDGQRHVPSLMGYPKDSVEIVETVITPNADCVDAGTYHITFKVAPINPNYKLEGGVDFLMFDFEFVINKQAINISSLEWDYKDPFTYDNEEHSVKFVSKLPAGVEAVESGTFSATDIGVYSATVTLKLEKAYQGNYVLTGKTSSTLNWEIRGTLAYLFQSEEKSGDSPLGIVLIDGSKYKGLPNTFKLKVSSEDVDVSGVDFSAWYGKKEVVKVASYNVKFVDENGAEVDVSKYQTKMTVKLFVPEQYREQDVKVFHVVNNSNVELLDAKLDGSYMKFEANHFSNFVIMSNAIPEPTPTPTNSNVAAIVISTGVAATMLTSFFLVLILAKKKRV